VTNSTLDLRPMVEGLSQVLRETLNADGISLTLLSPERNLARALVIDRDEPLMDTDQDLARIDEETLAGWIVRHSRALRLDDIEQAANAQPDLRPMFLGPNGDRARREVGSACAHGAGRERQIRPCAARTRAYRCPCSWPVGSWQIDNSLIFIEGGALGRKVSCPGKRRGSDAHKYFR